MLLYILEEKKLSLQSSVPFFCQIKVCINKNCIFGKIRHKDENSRKALLTLFYLITVIYSYMLKERRRKNSDYFDEFFPKTRFRSFAHVATRIETVRFKTKFILYKNKARTNFSKYTNFQMFSTMGYFQGWASVLFKRTQRSCILFRSL